MYLGGEIGSLPGRSTMSTTERRAMRVEALHYAGHAVAVVNSLGLDKLIVVCLVIVSATVLAVTGQIDSAAVIGLLTLIVGYVFGRATSEVERDNAAEDRAA